MTGLDRAERLAEVSAAAAPYVGPWWSRQVAAEVVELAELDVASVTEERVVEALRRRMLAYSMPCGDVASCARDVVRVVGRATARVALVAAGKSGPAWGVPRGAWVSARGTA